MTTLPVHLTVGDHTAEVGELELEPGEDVRTALADLFRAAADAFDQPEEVTPDGTA
ncbi:hypothetical protein [Streptomyces nigrescens]|uniref:hypothetical protein n=1 Tax=Streptomyces nigrescens TaxID=1920 RepID=UPI00369F11E0